MKKVFVVLSFIVSMMAVAAHAADLPTVKDFERIADMMKSRHWSQGSEIFSIKKLEQNSFRIIIKDLQLSGANCIAAEISTLSDGNLYVVPSSVAQQTCN